MYHLEHLTFHLSFHPKNEKEKEEVQKILSIFKFHMMHLKNLVRTIYLVTPSQFQITYMYRDMPNMYIPKISRYINRYECRLFTRRSYLQHLNR